MKLVKPFFLIMAVLAILMVGSGFDFSLVIAYAGMYIMEYATQVFFLLCMVSLIAALYLHVKRK